jgi:hypothetical protein
MRKILKFLTALTVYSALIAMTVNGAKYLAGTEGDSSGKATVASTPAVSPPLVTTRKPGVPVSVGAVSRDLDNSRAASLITHAVFYGIPAAINIFEQGQDLRLGIERSQDPSYEEMREFSNSLVEEMSGGLKRDEFSDDIAYSCRVLSQRGQADLFFCIRSLRSGTAASDILSESRRLTIEARVCASYITALHSAKITVVAQESAALGDAVGAEEYMMPLVAEGRLHEILESNIGIPAPTKNDQLPDFCRRINEES